jgi:protein-disulfide isomerase-like protein with CxxC motif
VKKHEYLILRYGSNAANQHLCNRAAVAIVEAVSQAEARAKAYAGDVIASESYGYDGQPTLTVYNNQHLEAIPRSKARASEWDAVLEADARNRR